MMSNVVGCPPTTSRSGCRVAARVGAAVRRPPPAGVPARLSRCRSPTSPRPSPSCCTPRRRGSATHTYLVADGERLTLPRRRRALGGAGQGPARRGHRQGLARRDPHAEQRRLRRRRVRRRTRRRGVRADQHVLADPRARLDDPPRRPHAPRRAPDASSTTTTSNASKPRCPGSPAQSRRPAAVPARRAVPPRHPRVGSVRPRLVTWRRGRDRRRRRRAPASTTSSSRASRSASCPPIPAVIVYSSGSTADPKGAIHTQGAVVRHSCNVQVGLPDRRPTT